MRPPDHTFHYVCSSTRNSLSSIFFRITSTKKKHSKRMYSTYVSDTKEGVPGTYVEFLGMDFLQIPTEFVNLQIPWEFEDRFL